MLHQQLAFPALRVSPIKANTLLRLPAHHTVLLDTLRQLLPQVKDEIAYQLEDVELVPTLLSNRSVITTAPDQHFDGSILWEQDQAIQQLINETAFAYLLRLLFIEALRQNYGLHCDPALLEQGIPELAAYTWFVPSPTLHASVESCLTTCALAPFPHDLAGVVYQGSLTKAEKKAFGQYYTPPLLVNHLLDRAGYLPGQHLREKRLLDVATGFGVFLAQAAQRLVSELCHQGCDQDTIFDLVAHNLLGFDLHPFPVIATKFHVLTMVLESLHLEGVSLAAPQVRRALAQFRLPGVRVADTLAQPFAGQEDETPDLVVGNPPYGYCRQGQHLKRYAETLNGRVNLSQLFLYFAVQRCIPGGQVALLLPESLRSGRYFQRLRHYLVRETKLLATTDFQARADIFPEVEQGILILVCQKRSVERGARNSRLVTVVQAMGEETLAEAPAFRVERKQVQLAAGMDYMLCKANSQNAYALLYRLWQLRSAPFCITAGVHTGRFVWNQHRPVLLRHPLPLSLPIIYAQSVHRFAFAFPPFTPTAQHPHLLYAQATARTLSQAKQGSVLLLQRTTAPEQPRRVIATLLPAGFVQTHPHYLIENHVNFIDCATVREETIPLEYLLGLLNSKLINFLFAALSGTTQVSAWELGHLPFLYTNQAPIVACVTQRLVAGDVEALALESQIDDYVYELYGLSSAEREVVDNFHRFKYSRAGQLMT